VASAWYPTGAQRRRRRYMPRDPTRTRRPASLKSGAKRCFDPLAIEASRTHDARPGGASAAVLGARR
jgi:hypothetical protein